MIDRALLDRFDGPFEWGTRDCVQFFAAVWEHRTGVNPADGFEYSTEEEALAIVEAHGSMEALVASRIGPSEGRQAVAGARDYDVVLTAFEGTGPMLCVASDTPEGVVLIGLAEKGWVALSVRHGLRIWRCP